MHLERGITLTVSKSSPASGFFLEQEHPLDTANPGGDSPVFLTGSVVLQQVSAVPEPSSWLLVSTAVFGGACIRRWRRRKTPEKGERAPTI
jgi:hypothetical protein